MVRWLLRLCVLALLLGALLAGGFVYLLDAKGPLGVPVSLVVGKGMGPRAIAAALAEKGVILAPDVFVVGVRVMGVSARLKAGEYAFEPGVSLRSVMAKLTEGETEERRVTVPEGWTVKQAMDALAKNEALVGTVVAPAEGHIFPDTYVFTLGMERKELLAHMVKRMDEELAKVWGGRDVSAPYKNPEELLIMASIVQKEAATNDEMPQIASVFVNRLRKGMRLQSDPTVLYGADTTSTSLHKKDLTEPQPFNTYVFAGLPPTPIANPGLPALMAAARPVSSSFLYFMASPDRTHHVFSDTYDEHSKHVKTYWDTMFKLRKNMGISKTPPEKEKK